MPKLWQGPAGERQHQPELYGIKGIRKEQTLPTRTLSVPAFADSVPSVSEDADITESKGMRKET